MSPKLKTIDSTLLDKAICFAFPTTAEINTFCAVCGK